MGVVASANFVWRQSRESSVCAANKLLHRKNNSLALVIFR